MQKGAFTKHVGKTEEKVDLLDATPLLNQACLGCTPPREAQTNRRAIREADHHRHTGKH